MFTFMAKSRTESPVGVALPIAQDRSRSTIDKLVRATETVLRRDGLEATTVAAVAAEAGLSVGGVYKRFPDKDALLRIVYARFFETAAARNAAALAPDRWIGCSAAQIIDALVQGAVHGHRQHRALLRALFLFGETHAQAAFRKTAETLRQESFAAMSALLLARQKEIRHPRPGEAIDFALVTLGAALRGLVFGERVRAGQHALSEAEVAAELSEMLKRYLRITVNR